MLWTVTTPPVNSVLTLAQLTYHLRLDSDTAAIADEQALVTDLMAAAVEYAETAMATSLLTRTITATFYRGEQVILPRGPVASVVSLVDGQGNPVAVYTWERLGNTDRLHLPNGWSPPLTVVYTAGYGSDPSTVPADVRAAIRVHVGTLYENRESVADKAMSAVPHSLEAFYARKCRASLVG